MCDPGHRGVPLAPARLERIGSPPCVPSFLPTGARRGAGGAMPVLSRSQAPAGPRLPVRDSPAPLLFSPRGVGGGVGPNRRSGGSAPGPSATEGRARLHRAALPTSGARIDRPRLLFKIDGLWGPGTFLLPAGMLHTVQRNE